MNIILIIIGIYLLIIALMGTTKNTASLLLLKIIPFFSGWFCIFYAVVNMGIININL